MANEKLLVPSIHLNGTSRDALVSALCDAGSALYRAIEAVGETAPNARDFYVQGDGAFELARRQHEARIEKLVAVRRELETILEALDND